MSISAFSTGQLVEAIDLDPIDLVPYNS